MRYEDYARAAAETLAIKLGIGCASKFSSANESFNFNFNCNSSCGSSVSDISLVDGVLEDEEVGGKGGEGGEGGGLDTVISVPEVDNNNIDEKPQQENFTGGNLPWSAAVRREGDRLTSKELQRAELMLAELRVRRMSTQPRGGDDDSRIPIPSLPTPCRYLV